MRYTKTINGKVEIKTRQQIVVRRDGMQIINPSEELILADGWEVYEPPVVEPTLESTKRDKVSDIEAYDTSDDVNIFYVGGKGIWADKATRAGLMLRFNAELAIGKTETALWYEGEKFPLSVSDAIQMLYAVEAYASACYDNTQMHLAAVASLETIEDVQSYDYRIGYPDKLHF